MVSQRYTTRSFKDKRIVERPPEEWVIVENTHEPLVDQATFDTVQERIKIKQPATWTNKDNMFRGLMICGGCNTRMVFTTRKNGKSKGHFSCNTHRRYGGKKCSSHYITLEQVTELLLGDIQKHAALAAADHDAYVEHLVQLSERESNGERISQQKEADTLLHHRNLVSFLFRVVRFTAFACSTNASSWCLSSCFQQSLMFFCKKITHWHRKSVYF